LQIDHHPDTVKLPGSGGEQLTTRLAWTSAQYRYIEDPGFEGNDIPGAPNHHVNLEVRYEHPAGVSLTPRIEMVPASYYLDSGNTIKNDSWTSVGIRAEWKLPRLGLTAFLEGRNLTDARYSASAQVDNAAGRYYEPADRRGFVAGFQWVRQ
jgi:iron complex outermembrane receptor protein